MISAFTAKSVNETTEETEADENKSKAVNS
jgi:hypothetical protein